MSLSFLSNITLASNEEVKPAFVTSRATRSAVDRNPEGNQIRLFKNGAIYPSKELAGIYALEYLPKDSEVESFGFDIMSSKSFPNTAHLPQIFLILAVVAKNLPKVDVFGSTKYYSAEDVAKLAAEGTEVVEGQPKSSVLDQGNTTFGKDVLIPMLKEVYGFEFSEDQKFVDLTIVVDQPLKTNDGNYFIPKPISRGEKKGEMEVVVRKDIDMFPLVLSADLSGEVESNEEVTVQESVEEAQVPEIDLTKPVTSKKEVKSEEPTIDDIIDGDSDENLVEVEGESIDPEISIEEEPEEAEEVEVEEETPTEEASEDDDFGDLSI